MLHNRTDAIAEAQLRFIQQALLYGIKIRLIGFDDYTEQYIVGTLTAREGVLGISIQSNVELLVSGYGQRGTVISTSKHGDENRVITLKDSLPSGDRGFIDIMLVLADDYLYLRHMEDTDEYRGYNSDAAKAFTKGSYTGDYKAFFTILFPRAY